MYTESKCIGAQECVLVCDVGALTLTRNGIVTNVDKCTLCGDCAEVCPTKAIEMSGEERTVEELMDIIRKEIPFMDQSGGGVTFSGGEPLHHHLFLKEMLDACGKEGIHRCVDTTGFTNKKVLLEIAQRTDLFLYDLKMMDRNKHKEYTGVSNEKILDNLITLASLDVDVIIRIPLIKGVNDDLENMQQSARFIAGLPGKKRKVNILPYHNIASTKYEKLGLEGLHTNSNFEAPDEQTLERCLNIFKSHGVDAMVGG